jgi:bifunctional non-homologous end joining protein LigD
MLATLVREPPPGEGWLFERKLDGERCLAVKDADRVQLLSRNRKLITSSYPEVAEALAGQPLGRLVTDGEVVALERGRESFAALQRRMQASDPARARGSGITVTYYVFDLLHAGGFDLRDAPLAERKRLLEQALAFGGPVQYLGGRSGDGRRLFAEACRHGWEGLIAKDAAAPYAGGRGRAWLKVKCVRGQEFVIGGFTDPKGSRAGLGAILAGYYRDGQLIYAGKVGTGFSAQVLRELRARLDALEQPAPPFCDAVTAPGTHWVAPELVAEVGFAEWTRAGRLRQPRFLGLRRDKDPRQVVREEPAS